MTANEACIRGDVPVFSIVFRMRSTDGTWRWILGRGKATRRDAAGRALRMIGTHIDVTDKKKAEEVLRENQSRLKLALRSAGMGVWLLDLIENKRHFDDQACHLLGIAPAEFTGTAEEFYNAVHPEDREILKAALARTIEQNVPYETEYRAVWPDGSVHYIVARAKLFRGETGKSVRVNGLLWDITGYKLAEEEANLQHETLTRIFESAPYIMMLLNKDGRVMDINRKGVTFGGKPKEELLGLLGGEVFSCLNSFEGLGCGRNLECTDCPVRTRVMHTFKTGQDIYNAEGRLTSRRDETDVAVDMLISTALIKDRDADKVLVTITDITDQKQVQGEREKLRERLLRVQKIEAVGQLAGGVAHDFNNMLAVILGHSEMALEQTNPEDKRYFDLQEIIKAASRSADITRQLLAFARKQTVNPKVLDLNDTISNMLKMLQRLIGEDIDLAWMPGHHLWSVEIDPSQVDQMLANLAVNARDAIEGIGKVTIETANVVFDGATCTDREEFAPGEYVLLAVTDTGAGMNEEVMDHIFEPFFTTKEVGKGTGLGLATLYGIVKQNQGFVHVYSEPGQGTTFKIYLPGVRRESIGQETAISADKPPVGRETVLIVEDEEAIMNLGKAILDRLGYTVLTAGTPEKAVRLAEEYAGDIELLITDVVMPEMNGKELAERLISMIPGLKCLFMSGYTSDIIARRGILDEAVYFIPKPFSMKEMAEKVRQVLES